MLQLVLDESYHAPDHRFHGIRTYRHLGELVLNGAKLRDRRTERFAILSIFEAEGKHILGSSNSAWAEFQSPDIEDVERNNVPTANLAQYVLDRDLHVVEVHCRGRTALHAHLVFFGA